MVIVSLSVLMTLIVAGVFFFFFRRHYEIQLKKALTRAQKSEQLKSVFIDNIGHTLKTPLNAILGYSDMILEDENGKLPPSQMREMATNIKHNTKMLIDFVAKLNELTKFDGITPCFTFIEVNLTELMASYRRETLNIANPDASVRVRTDLSPHCKATLDTNLMHQVMMHLLTNAVKYSTEDEIIIRYNMERHGLRISITYTGHGNSDLIGANIYSLLQKEDALKNVNEISELDLSISKAIVEILGGEIDMETKFGNKTVTSFWLPCQMRDAHKGL